MLESQSIMRTYTASQNGEHPIHFVSVRSLVEFVLQAGDLTPGGFQRRDRAQLGTQGHKQVQRSRPEGYETEVEVSYQAKDSDPPIEVRGRIDGLYPNTEPVIIEEIKTTTLSLDLVREDYNPLHWAQAQCYAYLYTQQNNQRGATVRLTYYHIDSQAEKSFERSFTQAELDAFFNNLVTPYLAWFRKILALQARRDISIQQFDFPYEHYRTGQREMAVAVYKAIRAQDRLYVQSPTGVGKTIAALFPSAKALGQGLAAKIFYLTAKTSGRLIAEKTLDDMRLAGLHLQSVTLTAKEKICFCPPVECDP